MKSTDTTPLSAESSPEDFSAAFQRLFDWGGRLERIGLHCPLRERGECVCSACPISQAHDPDGELHSLCRQGAELERATMLARVANLGLAASGV